MLKRLIDQKPILVINLKTYKEATGLGALKIAQAAERAAKETGKAIAIAAQPTDILLLSSKTRIPILAQHVDVSEPGASTGSITINAILQAGAVGTLINHSEKQLDEHTIDHVVELCKNNGLFTIICADTPKKAAEVSLNNPNFVAIEPPELIGTGISVSTAKPEIIDKTITQVMKASKTPILCGAGISTKKDVVAALKHGAQGVLLASAVAKHKNPYEKIMELLSGM